MSVEVLTIIGCPMARVARKGSAILVRNMLDTAYRPVLRLSTRIIQGCTVSGLLFKLYKWYCAIPAARWRCSISRGSVGVSWSHRLTGKGEHHAKDFHRASGRRTGAVDRMCRGGFPAPHGDGLGQGRVLRPRADWLVAGDLSRRQTRERRRPGVRSDALCAKRLQSVHYWRGG